MEGGDPSRIAGWPHSRHVTGVPHVCPDEQGVSRFCGICAFLPRVGTSAEQIFVNEVNVWVVRLDPAVHGRYVTSNEVPVTVGTTK